MVSSDTNAATTPASGGTPVRPHKIINNTIPLCPNYLKQEGERPAEPEVVEGDCEEFPVRAKLGPPQPSETDRDHHDVTGYAIYR